MKGILLFILGILLGAGALYIFVSGSNIRLPGQGIKEIATTQKSSPTAVPSQNQTDVTPTGPSQEDLERLRTRLYQQGIEVTSRVDTVYPGLGFILMDQTGTRIFVHWEGTAPREGETIAIRGVLKKVANELPALSQKPGFTADLNSFLRGQTIYIEAQEVPARTTPSPTP